MPRATGRPSAQQCVEHDDRDRNAECQESDDHECAARRGRRVCFHYPHRARVGPRTDRIVERNVGISQAAVSAHHGPSRAVVLFQDRDPSEPPEPTLADVGQVGTRDTGRTATATADAHTRKVRQVRAARRRREIEGNLIPELLAVRVATDVHRLTNVSAVQSQAAQPPEVDRRVPWYVYLSAILLIGWGALALSKLLSVRDFVYPFWRAMVGLVILMVSLFLVSYLIGMLISPVAEHDASSASR
jgi:hypothetical protein